MNALNSFNVIKHTLLAANYITVFILFSLNNKKRIHSYLQDIIQQFIYHQCNFFNRFMRNVIKFGSVIFSHKYAFALVNLWKFFRISGKINYGYIANNSL
jgi:hypothetical protein